MKTPYRVTVRRAYSDEYMEKYGQWRKKNYEDFVRPQFAEDEQDIWSNYRGYREPNDAYWDDLIHTEPMDYEAEKAKLVNSRYEGCCDKAIFYPCVCSYSTLCPDHGQQCHGTHD